MFSRIIAILSLLTASILVGAPALIAQKAGVPKGILFQAVALDAAGVPASKRTVHVKTTILQGSANGNTVYAETYEVKTSGDGLFTIVIGQGQRNSGLSSYSLIDWANGPFFLNIKAAVAPVNPTSGWVAEQQYINMGTSQFLSVPFANYAGNVSGLEL